MAAKLSRASVALPQSAKLGSIPKRSYLSSSFPQFRLFHSGLEGSVANPVAIQMINYALSHARSQKSAESYSQGLLVLEQCLSTRLSQGEDPANENAKGMVLLAMSTLLSERGDVDDAIDKLQSIRELTSSFLGLRVAAFEALVGLHLEMEKDDISSVLADKCLEQVEKQEAGSDGKGFGAINVRATAVKGLVELINGSIESAEAFFRGPHEEKLCNGSVALSYGEFLHAKQNFSLAKESHLSLVALCGSHHPKVGVILTCIALMFKRKAVQERSSSLLIQEGLYRRAIELLKAPPLETEGAPTLIDRSDIVALARGGYAEALGVQENRKAQAEKMKSWAEAIWRNQRLSLAEALENDPASKVPVIDARIGRILHDLCLIPIPYVQLQWISFLSANLKFRRIRLFSPPPFGDSLLISCYSRFLHLLLYDPVVN
ncbi:hypothetical protein L6164_003390 [Bauhinia variegata]|uniref:Uncharacterized protein n=1 Tax=Bauhinia variegata TaxID=167791 RepID=A0ACB9Q195_BAUVA|nr:hypothetical protein L6164_003390 [Bauhinia variegata]